MDEIKISGKWSIPNTDFIDFNADLHLNPSKNIIMLITYTKKPIGIFKKFDTIIGESTNGSKVTLYKCYVKIEHIKIGKNREYNAYIRADYCFDGVLFKSEDEVLFNEITVRFSCLDEWAFFEAFNFDPVKNFDYSLKYKRPKEIKYKVSKETTMTIFSDLDAPYGSVNKEVKITQKTYVSVKHKKPQTLEKSLDVIQTLMDFVSFCTFQKINYIKITGYSPNHFEIPEKTKDKIYYGIPIYVNGLTDEDYLKVGLREFLLNLYDLADNFKSYINNWFSKIELLKPVIDQYLNTLDHYHLSVELYFLSLIQALESYHRRTRKNYVTDESEHKKRVKSIIDLSPKKDRAWLSENLFFANEPNLKDRIDELTYEDADYWIFFSGNKEREKFLKDVKNTRNYFIHYREDLKDKALNGERLYLACEILKKIIEYHLLREIGLSYEYVRPKIVKKLGRIEDVFNIKASVNKK